MMIMSPAQQISVLDRVSATPIQVSMHATIVNKIGHDMRNMVVGMS